MMKPFSVIVAATAYNRGIGYQNTIPWKIPEDIRHFKQITQTLIPGSDPDILNAVIMGRKTWDSLPPSSRPLIKRLNLVLSKNPQFHQELKTQYPQVLVFDEFEKALSYLQNLAYVNQIFVIGGVELYRQSLMHPQCQEIYYTEIHSLHRLPVDVFFPVIDPNVWVVDSSQRFTSGDEFKGYFIKYLRDLHNHEEEQIYKKKQQCIFSF